MAKNAVTERREVMGSLIRKTTGDNSVAWIQIENLQEAEVVKVWDSTKNLLSEAVSVGGMAELDLTGHPLPLSPATLEVYMDNQLMARAAGVEINGGDVWKYTYLLDLKIDGVPYQPGDAIQFGRMTSIREERQIEIYNPNVLPLYGTQIQVKRSGLSFGYEWAWLSKDGVELSKVLDIGTLASGETWVGRLVQKRDASYPPPVPNAEVEVELSVTAQATPEVLQWKDLLCRGVVRQPAREDKVIVFAMPGSLAAGVQPLEIRFPFNGSILNLYASCRIPGSEPTVIHIEKISQDDFDGTSVSPVGWVFVGEMILGAGDKSVFTPPTPVLDVTEVNKNDHFRVRLVEVGAGIRDLTVEITITI